MSDNPAPELQTSINLGNINGGAAIEAFNLEIAKICANIQDRSTKAKDKRSILLQVDFEPDSDRVKIKTTFSCKTKLAGIEKHTGEIFIGRTQAGGFVALTSDPRQMNLWSEPKPQLQEPIEFRTTTT